MSEDEEEEEDEAMAALEDALADDEVRSNVALGELELFDGDMDGVDELNDDDVDDEMDKSGEEDEAAAA